MKPKGIKCELYQDSEQDDKPDAIRRVFCTVVPTMEVYNLFDNGKTQTRALLLAFLFIETVKEIGQILLRDRGSIVADTQPNFLSGG